MQTKKFWRYKILLFLVVALALAGCRSNRDYGWRSVHWTPIFSTTSVENQPVGTNLDRSCSIKLGSEVEVPPKDYVGVKASKIYADWLGGLLFLGLAVFSLWRWKVHSGIAKAEEGFDPKAPLKNGTSVVFGVVEGAPGVSVLSVHIFQEGRTVTAKNSVRHEWTEIGREVRGKPFYLLSQGGQRVRVEPGNNVMFHDQLSRSVRTGAITRTRVAELLPGEQVHIVGELSGVTDLARVGGYRQNIEEIVLRSPSGSPMMISTEKPGKQARAFAETHRKWMVWFAATLVIFQVFLIMNYRIFSLTGERVVVRAEQLHHWQEWVKPKNQPGRWVSRYEFKGRDAVGRNYQSEISTTVAMNLESSNCDEIDVTRSTVFGDIYMPGPARIGLIRLILFSVYLLGLLIAYPLLLLDARPWYLKRKVNDSGSGALPPYYGS